MLGHFTLRRIRRGLAIVLLVLVGGGFSAHAALIVLEQAQAKAARGRTAPAGFDTQDHFPGAALLYPTGDQAAPAVGATGTAALPDLPIPAGVDALAGGVTIHPARPFALSGASTEARGRALKCLTDAIYYEAASESEEGQRAVAQVVLNRVRHPAFPASVCGVVYQGSERTTGCQFSFACDGSMARIPARAGWARAARYAADALNGHVVAAVGEATHYHTYAVTPSWNRSLVMTAAIGAHFFHRWKGYWGTPAAFRQGYAQVEPFPGPAPRIALAAVAAPAIAGARPPAAADIAPAYRDSGQPKGAAPATAPAALPETTMLAKWQGTGQPLK